MRKLMLFTIGFAAACTFCSYTAVPWLLPVFFIGLALYLGLVLVSRTKRVLAGIALVMLGISLGFGWFWCRETLYLSHARELDGTTVSTTVTIADFGYETDYGMAYDGRITIDGKYYNVRVYLNEKEALHPGYTVSGEFRFRFTALGGEKDPTSHPSEGIFLLLYQRGKVTGSEPDSIPLLYYPAHWRQILLNKIEELFPEDTAGFAKALLLGERSGIDYETNTAFKLSGISHIIAVSGLHVSILFGLIYTLTLHRRWLASLIGIPALLLFAAVIGFTPSVTRACIMQSLMLLAMLTDREYDPPTALAFAVLTMLAVNPMTVTSISFQLSVGCMIGIFLFQSKIRIWFEDKKRFGSTKGSGFLPRCKRWFAASVSVSVSASVITVPLVAYYFGTVSLVSILTNLLTLWVISFVFYGIILCLILGLFLPGLAGVLAAVISLPIRYVLVTAKVLARLPVSAVYTESIYILIWLAVTYILLTVFLLFKRKHPLAFACCTAVLLCAAMLLSWWEPRADELRVSVLDVGQGQCILLQSGGETYMVDCGGDSDTRAADKAAAFLLSQGVDRLDGIILTHYDVDHTGGIPYLLTRIDTDVIYMPYILDASGRAEQLQKLADGRTKWVNIDTVLTVGSAKLTIFASETFDSENENGLCVLFQGENCDILITGDRGIAGEKCLLSRVDLPELEVLIAGHHGSAYSTGDALLAETTPETVIVSAGANNRYGHPAQALLERLAEYGCTVLRTDESGTVIYRG